MQANRYEPPHAALSDAADSSHPPLWSPGAAAAWCLLLTPAFGAYLQMLNWRALGQADRARSSRRWLIGCLVMMGLTLMSVLVAPNSNAVDGFIRAANLAVLPLWYFSNGRDQATWVREKFGDEYPRRGWLAPVCITIGLLFAFLMVSLLLLAATGRAG